MTPAERVAASRASQGLPRSIEDAVVLENIAALLVANDERPVPAGRIAEHKEADRVIRTTTVRTEV